MDKPESLTDFYQRKFNWMPEQIRNEIGHFNVFRLEPFTGENAKPIPYKRRDFYKVVLVIGNSKVHYADKVVEVKKQALSFSNPFRPRTRSGCKRLNGIQLPAPVFLVFPMSRAPNTGKSG